MYPGLVARYYARHKQIRIQLHEFQILAWCLASTILHFLITRSHRRLSPTFAQDRHSLTSVYAHSAAHQLHIDSTILQCYIFNTINSFLRRFLRTDVQTRAHLNGFFCLLDETRQPSAWPWHYDNASSTFTTVMYLLRLNCPRFHRLAIADFIKISHTIQPAIFNIVSRKVNKQTACSSRRTVTRVQR